MGRLEFLLPVPPIWSLLAAGLPPAGLFGLGPKDEDAAESDDDGDADLGTRPVPQIRVVVAEPHKPAEVRMIGNDLETMQALVGGYIEMLGDAFAVGTGRIICNEDGLMQKLRPNRRWNGTNILGTFFVSTFDGEGEFISLSETEAEEIRVLLEGAKVGN